VTPRGGRTKDARKPLLSVDEVAIQLGESRSTIYRALKRGDLPLPVYTINGRRRIPRRAVERLLEGVDVTADPDNPPATVCPNCEAGASQSATKRPSCAAHRRASGNRLAGE
jgi:excisionase family DNA binding protein